MDLTDSGRVLANVAHTSKVTGPSGDGCSGLVRLGSCSLPVGGVGKVFQGLGDRSPRVPSRSPIRLETGDFGTSNGPSSYQWEVVFSAGVDGLGGRGCGAPGVWT